MVEMKFPIIPILALASLLSMQGCVTKGDPISVLGTPKFVSQSQPDSVIETGIGQDPNTGGVFLQWYTTEGAAGYKIYRSDTAAANAIPINFVPIGNVIASTSLNDTSYVDLPEDIQVGVRYYYYLRGYAGDGSQGNPSDTINYRLLHRPVLYYPAQNALVDTSNLYLQWYDVSGGGYVVVRVKDITAPLHSTIWVSKRFQDFASNPLVVFNFDMTATEDLLPGHSYQWRVDRFNPGANEGARSPWSTFMVK